MNKFLESMLPYITNPKDIKLEFKDSKGCQLAKDCNICRLINCEKSRAYREGKR